MVWIVVAIAAALAVAIVGVRQAAVRIGTLLLGIAGGVASLWLLGVFFYVATILLVLAGFALLVAVFVKVLRPSQP